MSGIPSKDASFVRGTPRNYALTMHVKSRRVPRLSKWLIFQFYSGSRPSLFFVKHFSLKKASEFPVFIRGFSLLLAGKIYASLRMSACSMR